MRLWSYAAMASIQLATIVHLVPSPQTGPLDGKWTLMPAFTTSCSAGELSASLTVGQVSTRRTASDSLAITSNVAVSGGGMTYLAIHTLQTHLDSATRTFVFSGPVSGSAERGGLADTLTGKLDLRGTFVGSDSLIAQVEARLLMAVHGLGGASSGSCAPVKTRITATRIEE